MQHPSTSAFSKHINAVSSVGTSSRSDSAVSVPVYSEAPGFQTSTTPMSTAFETSSLFGPGDEAEAAVPTQHANVSQRAELGSATAMSDSPAAMPALRTSEPMASVRGTPSVIGLDVASFMPPHLTPCQVLLATCLVMSPFSLDVVSG